MSERAKEWYNRWWVLVAVLLLGFVLGLLVKDRWLDAVSCLNL